MKSETRSHTCSEVMRKRWAGRREKWAELIELHRDSGMTVSAFCEEMEIHPTSFYAWRKRLGESSAEIQADDFVEVEIKAECKRESGIQLEMSDVRVHIDPGFDQQTLRQLMSVLRDAS